LCRKRIHANRQKLAAISDSEKSHSGVLSSTECFLKPHGFGFKFTGEKNNDDCGTHDSRLTREPAKLQGLAAGGGFALPNE
jgi:hypothetical protein